MSTNDPTRCPMKNPLVMSIVLSATLVISGCSLLSTSPEGQSSGQSTAEDANGQPSAGGSKSEEEGTSAEVDESTSTPTAPPSPNLERATWVELPLVLTPIAELNEPTAMAPRSGFENLYVTERAGVVRLIERRFTDRGAERISLSSRPVLDISDMVSTNGERGLLGIAFSTDGRFMFVSYTDLGGDLVVAEYSVGRGTRADAETRRELIRIPQPAANHNGGQLALGPDGFLYIGVGDGGGAYDPDGNGQNTKTLLGSVLRIDTFTTGTDLYAIPAGNPFTSEDEDLAEIFIWGVRNPWRFSFDQSTGDLWLPDVGQDISEEINFLPASTGGGRGANLGWGAMEGYLAVEGASEPADHTPPIYVYANQGERCSITGGYVYRGTLVPDLAGAYIFGDFCSGEIFGLQQIDGVADAWPLAISSPTNQLASFGQGLDGEIYVLQLDGLVSRIELGEIEEEE